MDVASLKVADLKKELAARDLDTSGLKADLAARLQEHLDKNADTEDINLGAEDATNGAQESAQSPPVEVAREAADSVEAAAQADANREQEQAEDVTVTNEASAEEAADAAADEPPSTLSAIADAHSAGVEAVVPEDKTDSGRDADVEGAVPTATTAAAEDDDDSASIPKSAKPLAKVDTPLPPTRSLKVLHLTRPILANQLREAAEKFGPLEDGDEFRNGIFLDGIKSAGWITFKDVASAEALVKEYNGKPFPNEDSMRAKVFFYYVSPDVVPEFIAKEEALWEKEQGRLQIMADLVRGDGNDESTPPRFEFYSRTLKKGKKGATDDSTASSAAGGASATSAANAAKRKTKSKSKRDRDRERGFPPTSAGAGAGGTRIRGLAAGRPDASHLPPVVFPPVRAAIDDRNGRYHPYARDAAPPAPSGAYAKDIDYPIHPRSGTGRPDDPYVRERLEARDRQYDRGGYGRSSGAAYGGGYDDRRAPPSRADYDDRRALPPPLPSRDYDYDDRRAVPPRDYDGSRRPPPRDYIDSRQRDFPVTAPPRRDYRGNEDVNGFNSRNDRGYGRPPRDDRPPLRERERDPDRQRERQRSPVAYQRSRDDRYTRD